MNPGTAVNLDQQEDVTTTTTGDPEANLLPALGISS